MDKRPLKITMSLSNFISQHYPIPYNQECWREDFYSYYDIVMYTFLDEAKKYYSNNKPGICSSLDYKCNIREYYCCHEQQHQVFTHPGNIIIKSTTCYRLDERYFIYIIINTENGNNWIRMTIRPIEYLCDHDNYGIYKPFEVNNNYKYFLGDKESLYQNLENIPLIGMIPLLGDLVVQSKYINKLSYAVDYSSFYYNGILECAYILQLLLPIICLDRVNDLKGSIDARNSDHIVIKRITSSYTSYCQSLYIPEIDKVAFFSIRNNCYRGSTDLHIKIENPFV